jgi:plastocyanin
MTRTLAIALSCCAAGLFVAGCGGGSSSSEDMGTNPPAPAQTQGDAPSSAKADATITMNRIEFEPQNITVKRGALVRWVNKDSVEHNVTAETNGEFKSDEFQNGGTFETELREAGKVTYVCTIHPGMTGSILVR